MSTLRDERTKEKHIAVYDYYKQCIDDYKKKGLFIDIRAGRIYDDVAIKFYISARHVARIITKMNRRENEG